MVVSLNSRWVTTRQTKLRAPLRLSVRRRCVRSYSSVTQRRKGAQRVLLFVRFPLHSRWVTNSQTKLCAPLRLCVRRMCMASLSSVTQRRKVAQRVLLFVWFPLKGDTSNSPGRATWGATPWVKGGIRYRAPGGGKSDGWIEVRFFSVLLQGWMYLFCTPSPLRGPLPL